jgi:multisubunit Na+/H+ antiporter MnhB subunit
MAIAVVAFVGPFWLWGGGDVSSLPAVILPGSGLAALGAFLGRSRYRKYLYGALALTVCGLATLFLAFIFYSETADTAPWWAFLVSACPIGGIMSLVGAVLVIFESFRRLPVPKDSVEAA